MSASRIAAGIALAVCLGYALVPDEAVPPTWDGTPFEHAIDPACGCQCLLPDPGAEAHNACFCHNTIHLTAAAVQSLTRADSDLRRTMEEEKDR